MNREFVRAKAEEEPAMASASAGMAEPFRFLRRQYVGAASSTSAACRWGSPQWVGRCSRSALVASVRLPGLPVGLESRVGRRVRCGHVPDRPTGSPAQAAGSAEPDRALHEWDDLVSRSRRRGAAENIAAAAGRGYRQFNVRRWIMSEVDALVSTGRATVDRGALHDAGNARVARATGSAITKTAPPVLDAVLRRCSSKALATLATDKLPDRGSLFRATATPTIRDEPALPPLPTARSCSTNCRCPCSAPSGRSPPTARSRVGEGRPRKR